MDTNIVYYDSEIGQYVARTQEGGEVFGNSHQECEQRLQEANRVYAEHCAKNPPPADLMGRALEALRETIEDYECELNAEQCKRNLPRYVTASNIDRDSAEMLGV